MLVPAAGRRWYSADGGGQKVDDTIQAYTRSGVISGRNSIITRSLAADRPTDRPSVRPAAYSQRNPTGVRRVDSIMRRYLSMMPIDLGQLWNWIEWAAECIVCWIGLHVITARACSQCVRVCVMICDGDGDEQFTTSPPTDRLLHISVG